MLTPKLKETNLSQLNSTRTSTITGGITGQVYARLSYRTLSVYNNTDEDIIHESAPSHR